MIVILADTDHILPIGRKAHQANLPTVELIIIRSYFLTVFFPNKTVNLIGLAFSSSLSRAQQRLTGMDSKTDDIFIVAQKERLLIFII